jgi:hypothetical protein
MSFEEEIGQLKDTLIVMVEIQRRQADVQKLQAENIVSLAEGKREHEERMRHIELTLAEIGDKLNGLIGFMDGFFRKQ